MKKIPSTSDLETLSQLTEAQILGRLETSASGISESEANTRRERYGKNTLQVEPQIGPAKLLLLQFKSPLTLLLIVAALISGFLGSGLSAAAILVIIAASATINFINSYRSAQAAIALRQRVTVKALVIRGGVQKEVRVDQIVPGDFIILKAGDIVPADAFILDARDFFIDESVLSGESLPVEHDANSGKARAIRMGTSVVSGSARAIATATGKETEMGHIAAHLGASVAPTEYEKNFRDFSAFIFRIAMGLILAIILINIVFKGKNLLNMFLFAVAIAVGITPELLPVIIATNLAKGAARLAKGGVIVKRMQSIHNFGSIDILCTDKTGTLTEDRITLVKHVDAEGRENDAVLFWGSLSVGHATAVRNALDHAIMVFKKFDIAGWEKIDELPFDSERRRDSVVVRNVKEGKTVMIVKGAPEEILRECVHYGNEREKFPDALRPRAEEEYAKLSAEGFRVLGVAMKSVPYHAEPYAREDEKAMVFLGFLAFLDPPKASVKATIKKMSAYGVGIKIITGDNELVSQKIARELDLQITDPLSGDEIALLKEGELERRAEASNLFARVNPEQKEMIVKALRARGHVVGYMGDGVNDVLSLKAADVGISVNNAVDVAKETADIILLRKGLGEIIEGIIEGRKTFVNTFKYLMMALSSNFGNMFSMPIASIFLPFLPMTAPQILLNNLLYDSSQLAIPFDHVDDAFVRTAKKFDIGFLKKFMLIFGPLSSCFDFLTFAVLMYSLQYVGAAFQTGWFIESIATQTLVVNIIRTRFGVLRSKVSWLILISSSLAVLAGFAISRGPLAAVFGLVRISGAAILMIMGIVGAYLFTVELAKRWFYSRWGYLIEK